MGNFKLRVRRRRGNVQVSRLKRLASGSYVLAATVTYPNRNLRDNPLTLAELVAAKIVPDAVVAPE